MIIQMEGGFCKQISNKVAFHDLALTLKFSIFQKYVNRIFLLIASFIKLFFKNFRCGSGRESKYQAAIFSPSKKRDF